MLLDALGAFEDMPSWDDAADSLFNAGQTLNPSALHGAMAGLLGAGFSPHTEQHFAATAAALEKALAIDLTGDLVDFVSRLSLATLSAIQTANFSKEIFSGQKFFGRTLRRRPSTPKSSFS